MARTMGAKNFLGAGAVYCGQLVHASQFVGAGEGAEYWSEFGS